MNDSAIATVIDTPADGTQPATAVIPDSPKYLKADAVETWLQANGARHMWEARTEGVTARCYLVKGVPVIVTTFAGRRRAGIEVYIPAAIGPDGGSLNRTLDEAALAIGNSCLGSQGLPVANNS